MVASNLGGMAAWRFLQACISCVPCRQDCWPPSGCFPSVPALAVPAYMYDYIIIRQLYATTPSHAADAFRYLAVCWQEEAKPDKKDDKPRGIHVGQTEVTLNELWESVPKTQGGRI